MIMGAYRLLYVRVYVCVNVLAYFSQELYAWNRTSGLFRRDTATT